MRDPRLAVLHTLRLKGFAEADVVADVSGVDREVVAGVLTALAAEGHTIHRDGRVSGWAVSASGRAVHAALVARELDESGCRDAVAAGYRRFLQHNKDLLTICTDWQVRGDTPNDHLDAAYDREVVARLEQLHAAVVPIVDDLAAAMPRLGGYRRRLEQAVARTAAGEIEYFARPMIDSYHTVWFELHEDLLLTLGLERATEEA